MDLLTLTADELQNQLQCGAITGVQLVQQCIDQIRRYDDYLHAVIQVSPIALQHAKLLHEERLSGRIRGPLHGIPILLKDNIDTDPGMGMDTTSGCLALAGSRPKRNAEIVERMISAGMIILGKANLSELSGIKGLRQMPGGSTIGGQTQSAYTTGDVNPNDKVLDHSSPSGSSTGSAVAVSAGYAPLAIGTDTGGSLIIPSSRAALYALRPTMGLISQDGIIPISYDHDAAGPMAKSVLDIANMLDVLASLSGPGGSLYAASLAGGFGSLKIGALPVKEWLFPEGVMSYDEDTTGQLISKIDAAYEKIDSLAGTFKKVDMIKPRALFPAGGFSIYDLYTMRLKKALEEYLAHRESSPVRTLDDIIALNNGHATTEKLAPFDNQETLIQAAGSKMSDAEHKVLLEETRSVGREQGIDKSLKDFDVDVIIGPADSSVNLIIAAAGYPSATVPLSYLDYNGRPFGLIAFTTAGGEKTLLRFMKAWEDTFPKRRVPKNLVRGDLVGVE
ncbi:amidase signature domain-containing protein [Cadophora sp. MPI-SDFR-AT-0126]|nr:amidase signature domain-containing protein [Leotiomycetes sp. MPI-SDFR-AT-0126]